MMINNLFSKVRGTHPGFVFLPADAGDEVINSSRKNHDTILKLILITCLAVVDFSKPTRFFCQFHAGNPRPPTLCVFNEIMERRVTENKEIYWNQEHFRAHGGGDLFVWAQTRSYNQRTELSNKKNKKVRMFVAYWVVCAMRKQV